MQDSRLRTFLVANERIEAAGLNLEERVIDIWRCATVVKGGKRFSFAVMSVIGNGAGILSASVTARRAKCRTQSRSPSRTPRRT